MVRIIRLDHPLGLIQARMLGIRNAHGDVVICLDSHMEVQEYWYNKLNINWRSFAVVTWYIIRSKKLWST